MKQFKARHYKKRSSKVKIFLFLFIVIFSYVYAFYYLEKHHLKKDVVGAYKIYVNESLVDVIKNNVSVPARPVTFLNGDVKKAESIQIKVKSGVVNKEYKPVIYIYNTHQSEKYTDYSVYDMSLELSDKLTKTGIDNYFEEQSIPTFMSENKLAYYKSYTVSRKFMESAKAKYNSLKYFIDIHRDSVKKEAATINYNGKNYAKVLFIVGLDNPNHDANYANTSILNDIINKKVPGISKGIMQKQGKSVNGVYNEDFSSYVFLIEIGTESSVKGEAENTMNVLFDALKEYIEGTI